MEENSSFFQEQNLAMLGRDSSHADQNELRSAARKIYFQRGDFSDQETSLAKYLVYVEPHLQTRPRSDWDSNRSLEKKLVNTMEGAQSR